MAAVQRRWIDWNVKLRQTLVDGWDSEFVGHYAFERGFPRTASLNLANAQQGGRPVLDAENPAGEHRQLVKAIDQALRPVAGLPPVTLLSFQFNPSEFSEADEDRTVQRLTWVSEHVARDSPGRRPLHHQSRHLPAPDRQPPGALLRPAGVRPARAGCDDPPADVL